MSSNDPSERQRPKADTAKAEAFKFEQIEKRRNYIYVLTALAGFVFSLVAATSVFFQYTSLKENRSAISYERTSVYEQLIRSQQEQIKLLQDKINELESQMKSRSNKTRFYTPRNSNLFLLIQDQSKVGKPENSDQIININRANFRMFILPAIYSSLILILFCSALVCMFSREQSRKDVSLEITRTLITFLIGAATGQV